MATAMVSAYADVAITEGVAMTGELTLTGLVLPVGGIKEKLLAAHRSGFSHVIIPADNEADLTKLPDVVRDELTVTLADSLEDVLNVVLPELFAKTQASSG